MSKVICDICGTKYPDTADRCPLCGSSREYALEDAADIEADVLLDSAASSGTGFSGRKQKEIFDFDEVNMDDDEDDEDDSEDDDEDAFEDEPKSNTALVVVLVILIALLLMAVGFMFFRFFLPNIVGEKETTAPIVTTAPVEKETEEPTEFTVPCTDLSIPGGKVELSQEGQFWLLNVQVFPQNTTDTLVFASEDESVAVVDEDGRVTAVGEGKTVIHITCGRMQLDCGVTVDFNLAEETVEEETVPAVTLDGEEEIRTEETKAEEDAATTATEATAPEGAVLKLKKTDITMTVRYTSYQMELDCDIPPADIKWITIDSTKAIVVDGLITAVGPGTTKIVASYGGQSVECIVRCNFS